MQPATGRSGENVKIVSQPSRRWKIATLVTGAVVATGVMIAPQASASGVGLNQPTPVSTVPAASTPNITNGTVFSITQVGSQMIVGGSFTGVQNHGSTTTLSRTYVLAFDAATGAVSTTFAPVLDAGVRSVSPGPIANTVYVGGSFGKVNGVTSKGVTLLNTSTGAIVTGFKPPALNGIVYSLTRAGARVLLAGSFTTANGVAHGGLASLNSTTGALDPFLSVQLTGHHNYTGNGGANGGVGPRAMAINPAGTRAVAIGNFKNANGVLRDQIVMIDLDGASATLDPWATGQFTAACFSGAFDTYMTDVQYSQDGSYFGVTATGGSGTNTDGSNSLCDTASRWESSVTGPDVKPTWVDYTGQDSLWSIEITGSAIYVGGHQRWQNNSNGHDNPGPGAVPRPGLAALDPVSGAPLKWNPGRNPRGAGAYALYASPTGLYVGSDTDYFGNFAYKRQKIGFFPLAGGSATASTATTQLPSNLYQAGQLGGGASVDDLAYRAMSGSQIGPRTTVPNTGVAWGSTRGAFMVGNSIFYGHTDGNFYRASFDGTTVGTPVILDPYNDPAWSSVQTGSGQTYQGTKPGYYSEMSSVTGAFYSNGRLYYSLIGQSALYSRWFSPDSGIIGSQEFSTGGADFSNIAGMVLSGSSLYYANRSTGALHKLTFTSGAPDGSTDTVVDTGEWRARGMFLNGSPAFPNQLPTATASWSCTGLSCTFDGSGSTDPDGTIASYAWTFGDGTTGTGAHPTHSYAQTGDYNVTLIVTDNRNGQSPPWNGSVSVSGPSAHVSFVGQARSNKVTATPSVVVPAVVSAGDTEFLFVTTGTAGVTTSAPTGLTGWQQIGRRTNAPLETTIYQRVATAGDGGTTVTVPLAASTSTDLQFVDYSGVAGGAPTLATAGDTNVSNHVTPSVTAPGGSWVVSYWADRNSSTSVWTLPANVSSRSTGVGTGGGHVDGALADTGQPVAGGSYGGLTASTGVVSGKGDMVSLVLVPGTAP